MSDNLLVKEFQVDVLLTIDESQRGKQLLGPKSAIHVFLTENPDFFTGVPLASQVTTLGSRWCALSQVGVAGSSRLAVRDGSGVVACNLPLIGTVGH